MSQLARNPTSPQGRATSGLHPTSDIGCETALGGRQSSKLRCAKGGVRLNVEGLDVPDEFVLLISNKGKVEESAYKVVWRFGNELGAQFVSGARRLEIAGRDFAKA
jgi:hypothetical protein